MQRRMMNIGPQATYGTAAGTSLSWDLSKIPSVIDGMYVHVAGFMLKLVQQTTQAATTGSAVKGADLANIVSKAQVIRTGSKRRIALGGQSLRVVNALYNGGAVVESDPADLAANTGAALTTAQTFHVFLAFENRNAYTKSNKLWPAAAMNSSGKIQVDLRTFTAAYDSTISGSATVNSTVDCYALLELLPYVMFGIDTELVELLGAGTPSTSETITLDANSDCSLICLAPWKFGSNGGETLTYSTIQSPNYAAGIFPSLAGADYKYHWLVQHGKDRSNSLVDGNKCMPLFQLSEYGKYTECARFAAKADVQLTLSTAATNQLVVVVERVLDRDRDEMRDTLHRLNIDPDLHTAQSMVADGRPVERRNEKFVPKIIVPGKVRRFVMANRRKAA